VRIPLNSKKPQNGRKDLLKYVSDYIVVCKEWRIDAHRRNCYVQLQIFMKFSIGVLHKIVRLVHFILKGGTKFPPVISVFIAQFWANFCTDVHRMSVLRIGAMEDVLCVMV
jgi:hypothetical protein